MGKQRHGNEGMGTGGKSAPGRDEAPGEAFCCIYREFLPIDRSIYTCTQLLKIYLTVLPKRGTDFCAFDFL